MRHQLGLFPLTSNPMIDSILKLAKAFKANDLSTERDVAHTLEHPDLLNNEKSLFNAINVARLDQGKYQ
jgi:hypothetical protein